LEILCPECKKKNLISNRFCYKCGKLLRPAREKELSYNSVEDFLATLKKSSYYENRLKKLKQNKFILKLIFILIFLLIITTTGFIIILPEILEILFR